MKGGARSSLGVSWPVIFLLAALGVPRVVAHDLGLVGPVGNALLVFTPVAVWLAVVRMSPKDWGMLRHGADRTGRAPAPEPCSPVRFARTAPVQRARPVSRSTRSV